MLRKKFEIGSEPWEWEVRGVGGRATVNEGNGRTRL